MGWIFYLHGESAAGKIVKTVRGSSTSQVQRDTDPTHLLQDPGRFRSLSEQEQCTTYQKIMRGLRSLPSPDAAMIFRYMMSARVRGAH
jgi:hypothetical protein